MSSKIILALTLCLSISPLIKASEIDVESKNKVDKSVTINNEGIKMLDEINEKLKELTNLKDLSSQQLIQRKEIVVKEMNKLVVLINDSSQEKYIHERANNIFDLYQIRLREILVATLNNDLKTKNINKSNLNYLMEDNSILVVEGMFDKTNIESFFTDIFVKVVLIDLDFKEIRVVNPKTDYAKKVSQKEYKKFNGIEEAVVH